MSAVDKSQLSQLVCVPIGTQSATASLPGPKIHKNCYLKSVKFVNGASLAVDDTNYLVVELKIGSTVVASLSTKLTSPGKLLNQALTTLVATGDMLGSGAPYALAAGDQLSVVCTKNGTGVPTLAAMYLEVELK